MRNQKPFEFLFKKRDFEAGGVLTKCGVAEMPSGVRMLR